MTQPQFELSQNDNPGQHPLAGKEVLVTGATGFTGKVLVKKLLKLGASVRAIARPSSDISDFKDEKVSWIRGDVYTPEVTQEAAQGVQYIFHVAAAFRQPGIEEDEYRRVHVDSTRQLAELAVKQSKFERFIHISTMGVHGHVEDPPGDENSPYAPGDEYQRTKLKAEQWFREFALSHELPFTILRPTGIYGPSDRRLFKVFRMAKWPIFPILGNGKCYYHLVHVEDLTDAMILSATHPGALSETFLVGNSEAIQLEEMARIISEELGGRTRIVRIPVSPFFLLADLCELICKPFGIDPPIYRRRVAFYTKDRWFKTTKIRDLLQFECKFSNEEGIRQTARWYRENGWL